MLALCGSCDSWAVARFTFFIGKGGVGKTTVSTAYALQRAAKRSRARILLLSTDPAHSLADVLRVKLSNAPKRLPAAGRLWARQIDPEKQIAKFLRAEREEILALLNKGSLFTRDELEPLLDTSLPGMAEVAALLAVHDLLDSEFDEVVVDTAPMGHAIRLFQMPQHFARFLDVLEIAASRDVVLAQHFGGHVEREPALDRWGRMVERVEQALSATDSKLVLVTTAEPFSLKEAARSASAFQGNGALNLITEIVLNRVVDGASQCSRCSARERQGRAARKFLRQKFPKARVFAGEDPGCPILGIKALRAFGRHVFEGRALGRSVVVEPDPGFRVEGSRREYEMQIPHRLKSVRDDKDKLQSVRDDKDEGSAKKRTSASLRRGAKLHAFRTEPSRLLSQSIELAEWPLLATPLALTLGKGGVGKTTISASLAYRHRKTANDEVSICSIDPAPSLDDIFAAKIGDGLRPVLRDPGLRAAEFDAMAQFRQWAERLRERLSEAMTGEERGVHLDLSLDRKFLLALLDVAPPGVDEIFAIFRILDLLRHGERVVIDMAPTGHALEVLRTPARLLAWSRVLLKTLAAHRTLPLARDAAVEIATLSQNVRELASILRDQKRCELVVVTLPEPLPDHETRRLLRDLAELQAPLGAVFVNRVLMDVDEGCARCQRTARWQAGSLAGLKRQMRGAEVLVLPEFDSPPAGARGLQKITRKLWRLA